MKDNLIHQELILKSPLCSEPNTGNIRNITLLDNFDLVTKKGVRGGFNVVKKAIEIIQSKKYPKVSILCEPFLTKEKLYPTLSGSEKIDTQTTNILDFLQFCDGKNSLEKISKLTNIKIKKLTKFTKISKN